MDRGFRSYHIHFNTFMIVVAVFVWAKVNLQYSRKRFQCSLYLSQRLDKTKIYMQDRKKQTDAAYSSSSFARAASSSSLFSNLNQRSSATRGKREGNAVENVAMLNSLNFLFGFDDTVQHT